MNQHNDILAGFEAYATAEELSNPTVADLPATSWPCIGNLPPGLWTIQVGC
ncbi:MAG: hypothetical protein ACK5MT_19170 [Actinomycetales bacterium]